MSGEIDLIQVPARELRELRHVKHALDRAAIVAVTDAFGRLLAVNDKFCEISKYARHELIGQDHRIVNSGHHPKPFMAALWQRISSGGVWRGELLNRAKDGGLYWVDTTIVPFLDDDGVPYQFLAIHYDITDRKRAEAQLRDQALLAQIGEMAAVIAHEVKNPLTGIGGALQIIERQLPAQSSITPVIGQIQERLASVNHMVQDLLYFASPSPPHFADVDARVVIARAAALFGEHPLCGRTQVEMHANDARLRGDSEHLAIALVQMLVNAAQAVQGTGRVSLRVEASTDTCAFAVSDDGPGIPSDLRPRLSKPFQTTKTRGLGLGLAIARRVAEEHDGRLTIESEPGRGTIVALHLPRQGAAR
jgi:PAS domain S-box-containing protein